MSKRNTVGGLAAIFLAAWWAGPAPALELRIAYLDMARVLEEAPQATAASRELEAEFVPQEQRLLHRAQALAQLEARLQQARTERNDVLANRLEAEFAAGRAQLARAEETYEAALSQRLDEELVRLQETIRAVVSVLAEERRYDLVLFEGVLWASPRVDITGEVLTRLGAEPP